VAATPQVVPQANSLAQYYSYTYNISIYVMSPNDYKKLVSDKKRNIAGYQLLMQSGGAPFVNSQAATPQGAAPAGGLHAGASRGPSRLRGGARGRCSRS
jgi:hypothetical protein